jgi:predicted RNase H-like nuclease (RuvC/YqgF family)
VERAEAQAIYDQGREVVVAVLLRMDEQIQRLTERVARQEERIGELKRRLGRNSRNSSRLSRKRAQTRCADNGGTEAPKYGCI